jgi:hypothetical protein
LTATAEAEGHLVRTDTAKTPSTSCLLHANSQNPDLDLTANNFEETVNIQIVSIYQANPPKNNCEKDIPVYLHLINKNQYIP